MSDFHDRRAFLRAAAAAGAAWAAADVLQVEEALAWAAQQKGDTAAGRFVVLLPADAAAIEALTSRILPSEEGSPGAREAGVVHFIDRSLSTFARGQTRLYRDGVRELNQRAMRDSKTGRFADLTAEQQDQIIGAIEKSEFFQAARAATIIGTFALPTWGGNRDHVGWRLIGLDHQPAFQPPFGYYDAEANGKR